MHSFRQYFSELPRRFPVHTALSLHGVALQLVRQLVCHLRAAHRIVEKRDLHHQKRISSADGDILCLSRLVQTSQCFPLFIDNMDRIAQLLIIPVPEIDLTVTPELDDTLRGDAGFGSSGV